MTMDVLQPPARGQAGAKRPRSDERIRAVVFDLWGTLVPSPVGRRDEVCRAMGADLGVDPDAYAAAFRDSYAERFCGTLGSLEETVLELARRCGGEPEAGAVARAARRRVALTRELLVASDDTVAALDQLAARGFRLGLVTDSSAETPLLWPDTPLARRLEAATFSCLLGRRMPDPAIFHATLERLGVLASEAVYVGDGGGGELTAARRLGMLAIRLQTGEEERYEDDSAFEGMTVGSLKDLLSQPWALGEPDGGADPRGERSMKELPDLDEGDRGGL